MARKILAIVLIYLVTSGAWMILGGVTMERTGTVRTAMQDQVAELWGSSHRQQAPEVYYEEEVQAPGAAASSGSVSSAPAASGPAASAIPSDYREKQEATSPPAAGYRRVDLVPDASDIKVSLALSQRKKGLLWFSTYTVGFDGTYAIANPTATPRDITVLFTLPTQDAIYDDLKMAVDGRDIDLGAASQGRMATALRLAPGERKDIRVSYRSRGLDTWVYSFGKGATQVKNFRLEMVTDFKGINFPGRTISPTDKEETPGGWRLVWDHKSLVSGFTVGMEMPKRLNPGPLASQISFFAPISLLFFFFVVFVLCVVRDIKLHPMHYFFLAAAFFAFHLLFAYLVDHIDVNLAFAIASVTSVSLVVSYLRVVVGRSFAFREAAAAQLVYLVLFSYTHFFKGFTGLSVTIVAIVTLAAAMHLTARVDWDRKFRTS